MTEEVNSEMTEESGPSLPPGIRTEAVLSYLGNLSQALADMANGINQTITTIVTEGTKGEMPNEEGE
tara:strand:+ start:2335 stop:2535 length:201 start_codon:yes stop_codon:yes gene_type:complete